MFKKVWSDPVWSKVISGGIIAVCAYIYSLFSIDTFSAVISKIWNYQISLGWTVAIITIILTIQGILNKRSKSVSKDDDELKISYLDQKKEKFRKAHTKFNFSNNILVRFTTWFHTDSGLPFISDPVAYCNLHDVPMRMNSKGCSENNCKYNNFPIDMRETQHKIESVLINEW